MSEERPETCEMCGAPVVWCKCGMSEDIVDRLRDLKKWYGFIMTTERMISSNQTIEAAAVEIERLTAENEKVCKALPVLPKNEHPKRGRPPKKVSKMVQTGLWLYENQIQWIKEEAERLGITASELLRNLIDEARGG